MSSNPIGLYTEQDAREIHKRVLGVALPSRDLGNAQQLTIHNMLYYAVLEEDLTPATDNLTGYTSAQCRIIRYVQPVRPESLDMEQAQSDAALLTVTNRYTTFSASAGDLLLIIRHGSEWAPVTAAGGSNRHAKIVECLGNGFYTARLVNHPAFIIPSPETGTGTVSDIGTGTGTMTNECDLCDLLYGGNEPVGTAIDYGDAICRSLLQPTRTTVSSEEDLIYVYDPRKLTLSDGAHVIVSDLGDKADDPAPVVGTGTGTGTAIPQVSVWMVLTGNYDLIGIPDRFYECCPGPPKTVKMVQCDTYITEGTFCPGNRTYCPVGTGSA